ncbi:MAG: alpha-hydroxy acid oxidase [Jatrophihabitans sp.]|uniref:alpha-hydroxy acid oxidase n=1 Tax=Jatrophihabitans sp. TaxID=1932789 RepID=UPI003F810107
MEADPDEVAARAVLPPEVWDYYAQGAGQQQTLHQQAEAWRQVWLRPRLLQDVREVDTATTVLGTPVRSPVLVAPTALHGLAHPDGEVATAAAARRAGSLFVNSMRAGRPLPEIAATAGPFWQQIYVLRDRGVSDEVARCAADCGARALVVTVDTPYVARKAAAIPARRPTGAVVPSLADRDLDDPRLQQAADLGIADLGRLHDLTGLPVVVKGVLRGDEAVRCVDAGAAGVIVSSHGGRQLDGVVPVPRALADVVDAIDGRAEIYADGGVRTGIDVLRALALGAGAVLVGRPVLWALAIGGEDAVVDRLTSLGAKVREALALAGSARIADVGRDLVSFAPR